MSGVSGDFAGMERLSKALLNLTGISKKISHKSADPLGAASRATYMAGQNPYGEAWPPTKTQGPRVLRDSGALMASATTFAPQGSKLKGQLVPYGRYQNPNLFLPRRDKPPSWEAAVHGAAEEAIRETMAGAE